MNKKTSCTTCKKRKACKELCPSMTELLANYKTNNDTYSDKTINEKEHPLSHKLDNVFFTLGLSEIQRRDTKRIAIAILNQKQTKILTLYCNGLKQSDIAKKLNISQSTVSLTIKRIRYILKQSYINIMPHIL